MATQSRSEILQSLSDLLSDYRAGEIELRTPALIENWLAQFGSYGTDEFLAALLEVLSKTYVTKEGLRSFLGAVASSEKVSGGAPPADFWREAKVLNIQLGGRSQKDLLLLFNDVLKSVHGFDLSTTGSGASNYVYLDDCICSGTRLRSDICKWLEEDSLPASFTLTIVVAALFEGAYWAYDAIETAAKRLGKIITLRKLSLHQFENRRYARNESDVLWPTKLPDDKDVLAYAELLASSGHPATLRVGQDLGKAGIFSDAAQRELLEQTLLRRGAQIRAEQTHLPDRFRPLGYSNLDTLGAGSMFMTYRNCANNVALPFWVGQDDYPALLPRRTNSDTATEQLLKDLGL